MILYHRVWNEHEDDDWPGQYEYQRHPINYEVAEQRFNELWSLSEIGGTEGGLRVALKGAVNAALGIEGTE